MPSKYGFETEEEIKARKKIKAMRSGPPHRGGDYDIGAIVCKIDGAIRDVVADFLITAGCRIPKFSTKSVGPYGHDWIAETQRKDEVAGFGKKTVFHTLHISLTTYHGPKLTLRTSAHIHNYLGVSSIVIPPKLIEVLQQKTDIQKVEIAPPERSTR